MLPDPKVKCPATGFAKKCRDIVSKCDCPKYVSVKFRNPQTGEMTDKYGCADSFTHLLLIENSQMSRQVAAEIEKLRDELAKASEGAALVRGQALVEINKRLGTQ